MTCRKIKGGYDRSNLDKMLPELISELAFANETEVDLFTFNLRQSVEDRKLMRLLSRKMGVA